ncbi:MAG TPA: diguanylate cyclase [Candidatus Hydrogenedentes bacterium]|jgi:diguanylate cyclase (GGDEF)-like protein/PAS domain S-box-containing protein|nr:MAG: putative diguanylate cyclase [Candidatus Hydrogenedentes bacterium ADurb.Bin170]HNZ48391.1 diguanylate cyclase [Candidatus Hydrogenedentota bacterium]HPX85814.1 diguanylate cyclase [Candidatus Hydrogenedentota bacterium]HQB01668.1 diguanylate cyclase [Candidatus Hydrogenedentota bacterium]
MLTQEQKDFYDAMNDGVYIVDRNRKILYWNKAAEEIAGFTAEEVIGKSCADNILIHVTESGVQLCTGPCPIADSIQHARANQARVYLHHKEGHRVPVYVRTAPFLNQANSVVGGIELFSMDAPRLQDKKSTLKSQESGQECTVTHLPNRRYLERELKTDLEDLREHDYHFGIILFQIDGMDKQRASHSEEICNALIKIVGKTVAFAVRPFDVVGRWGEASFLGIFATGSMEGLDKISERVKGLVAHSKIIENGEPISVSVLTAATLAEHDDTVASIVERAEALLASHQQNT